MIFGLTKQDSTFNLQSYTKSLISSRLGSFVIGQTSCGELVISELIIVQFQNRSSALISMGSNGL